MKKIILIIAVMALLMVACQSGETSSVEDLKNWSDVEEAGKDKTVTILMWGGNESINQYMDGYVSDHLKNQYGITLNRVPMNAPEYLSKLLNEKKSGVDSGTADLVWINAENFRTAKEGGLLDGPFTHLLPNLQKYYDLDSSDLNYDSGIAIEGYEAIWGKAQLVFSSDIEAPKSYKTLLDYAKANPGRITYPRLPDDFAGVAFVRNAYYELIEDKTVFLQDLTREEFEVLSAPVMDYFEALAPYLWNQGQVYPASQAQLDELFRNGEVDLTMGFEIGKTAGLIESGVYDEKVTTFVFDSGTIGNSHYLAIPFNAPEKAAALLTIDFLQSPQAQIEKMKASVWGDMPSFDVRRVSEDILTTLDSIEDQPGMLKLEVLNDKRNPEMKAQYIDWIKEIWTERFAN